MKIRLAILESDQSYLNRIVTAFGIKYADKLEVYSFTSQEVTMEYLETSSIDVFLADKKFEIDIAKLPSHCGFAYLVDMPDIESVRNQRAICKFQKADLIYKQILSIFSENASDITGIRLDEKEGDQVIAFLSASGGTGSSTAAAACAIRLAQRGKKVLYLNMERFGTSDVFFQGEGQGDFGDIIYALKSKKSNLRLRLESVVKQDVSGVFFYSAARMALDMAELSTEESKRLLKEIRVSGGYDYMILDMEFSLEQHTLDILNDCNRIILVSDGSAVANVKLERALTSLGIIEQQTERKLLIRTGLLYNRFSSHTSQKISIQDVKELGGIKRYEGYQVRQLLEQLAQLNVFDALA